MSTSPNYRAKDCCLKMAEQLNEANIFDLLEKIWGSDVEPSVFVCSDGGHGGMESISFCPFCGTKIVVEEIKPEPESAGELWS